MKKNPSSSKKPRRSKSSLKRLQRKLQRTQSSSEFGYEHLEPRYALDASFAFDNGDLDLFNFSGEVVVEVNPGNFTATLPTGVFEADDPDNVPDNVIFAGGTLTVDGGLNSVDVNLGGNSLTFGGSNSGVPINITNAGDVNQSGPVILGDVSINGTGAVLSLIHI